MNLQHQGSMNQLIEAWSNSGSVVDEPELHFKVHSEKKTICLVYQFSNQFNTLQLQRQMKLQLKKTNDIF